jgi:hypothetical protein
MSTETPATRPWRWLHAVLAASLALNLAAGYGYWHIRTRPAHNVSVEAMVQRLQLRPAQAEQLVALRARVRTDVERVQQTLGKDEQRRLSALLETVAADDVERLNREFGSLAQHRLALQVRIVQETLRFRDGLDNDQRARFVHALAERGFVAQLAGLNPAHADRR